MKRIFAVTSCIIFVFIMLSSYSMESKSTEKKTDFFEEQMSIADKRIKNIIEKMEAPSSYNFETKKMEKIRKFSISLKRLKNIVLEHGDSLRISLQCRIEFDNNDKMKRIEFIETKIKVKNSLEQIRNIINENPLSGSMNEVYVEFKDYNQDINKSQSQTERFTFSEITDSITCLELRNIYIDWLEEVRYKLYMINRASQKKRGMTSMHAFDI